MKNIGIGIAVLTGGFIIIGLLSTDSTSTYGTATNRSDNDDYQPTKTFSDYPCTDDCSGHEAGYQWAEKRGITDPDDCGGNSNSFIEGCMAWAQEN